MLLSLSEGEECSKTIKTYYKTSSPIYALTSSTLCVIKVYMEDKEGHKGNQQHCKKRLTLNIALSMDEYLSDGQRAVASKTPLTFNLI